ncbi:hypothetical protein HYC85_004209 [Camellia sinensis]|uniref:Uncharacterized protein n=1 Tax=Camellia sinensis TaxID=4442 RepID=A0A7J7HY01_CAMSI|nr:hypothetical protein HYC85_004209 [Camellia sinensis]
MQKKKKKKKKKYEFIDIIIVNLRSAPCSRWSLSMRLVRLTTFTAFITRQRNGLVHIGMSLLACQLLFRRDPLQFLGGGTAAHLMLDLWPSLVLEGWEIDEIRHDSAPIMQTSDLVFGMSSSVFEDALRNLLDRWSPVPPGPGNPQTPDIVTSKSEPIDLDMPIAKRKSFRHLEETWSSYESNNAATVWEWPSNGTSTWLTVTVGPSMYPMDVRAREYLGLSDLEKHTSAGGILHVHAGDALSPSVNIPGGYAGIVIDLFSDGKVLPELQEREEHQGGATVPPVATWLELYEKLMPNGRLMVNCGAANDGASNTISPEVSSIDGTWVQNSTIKALCQAFPGHLNWKKMPKEDGENYLALTGPLPDLSMWSAALPNPLSSTVKQWRRCLPS